MGLGNRKIFLVDLLALTPFYDRYLAEAIAARHVDLRFYTTSFPYETGFWETHGVARATVGSDLVAHLRLGSARLRRGLQVAEYCANWTKLVVDAHRQLPAVVHIEWLPLLDVSEIELLAVKQLSRAGCALVYTVHNTLPHDGRPEMAPRYRHAYELMDRLLVHTETERARLSWELGISEKRVDVVPHGPMFHDFPRPDRDAARRGLGLGPDDEVALFLGIVRPYKGLEDLVRAAVRVSRTRPRFKLVIAGQGDSAFVRRIRAEVRAAGVSQHVIHLSRYISVAELPALYAAADVAVLPYRSASQSGALFTIASFETPLVATTVGGIEEVLAPLDCATLVPPSDPVALADAIDTVLDTPIAQRRARAARLSDWVMRESPWERAADLTLEAYERAIAERARRAHR